MARCKSCGNPLQIEDKYCAYCGKENVHFKQYREDMEEYQEEFTEVKEDIYNKTNNARKNTVGVMLISILIVLNMGCVFLMSSSYEISYWLDKVQIEMNSKEHLENLIEFEENENFIQLGKYYENNSLRRVDFFEEYEVVSQASGCFERVLYSLVEFPYYEEEYQNNEIEFITSDVEWFYRTIKQDEYDNPKMFEGIHKNSLVVLEEQFKRALMTYANLNEETIESFKEASKIEIGFELQKGLTMHE